MGFSVSQGTSTGLAYFYTYYVKPKALSMIVELWLKDTPTWFERYNPTSEKKVSELGERFYKVIYFLVTGKDSSGQNYLLDNLYLIIFLLEAVAIGIIFLLYYRKRRQKAPYFSGGSVNVRDLEECQVINLLAVLLLTKFLGLLGLHATRLFYLNPFP